MKMRKIVYLCLLSLLLCGCSNAMATEKPEPIAYVCGEGACVEMYVEDFENAAVWTGEEDQLKCYIDPITSKDYTSEEEFFASEFCQTMREEGYTPYRLVYDTEQYDLSRISCDASFYEYQLVDKETGDISFVSIQYDVKYDYMGSIKDGDHEDFWEGTAEVNGTELEVYAAKPEIHPSYLAFCVPFEGYVITLDAGHATVEETLAVLKEFTLAPVE